jgi:hypothetical protein
MTKPTDRHTRTLSPELMTILRWTASVGAVTAESLAHLHGIGVASARGRLSVATRERLLARHRLLYKLPALYTVTRAGLRAAKIAGLEPCRVSAANSLHTLACAHAAAELQRRYPNQRVVGECELRGLERRLGAPVAGATMRGPGGRGPMRHRPDLVLWPEACDPTGPVAVEIELTVKAPRRLDAICRAWARSREVAGVLYLAPPDVERALRRAIDKTQAAAQIVALPLDALPLVANVTRTREVSQADRSLLTGLTTDQTE